jgi:hypothetical protein
MPRTIHTLMGEPMNEYAAAFEWRMTNDEIEVYKIAVLYEKEYRRIFLAAEDAGDRRNLVKRNILPQKTDPRKCSLFRYCWKLRRETRGLLEPSEYKQYITANLTIIKISPRVHVIEPTIICGDKAWIRYKIWKRRFEAKMDEAACVAPAPSVNTTSPKIIQEIDRTKKFLYERCEGEPSFDKLKGFIDSGMFKFWVATGKVSQFYVVMSPWVAKAGDVDKLAQQCSFSGPLMREKCTQEVKDYFGHEYSHEHR